MVRYVYNVAQFYKPVLFLITIHVREIIGANIGLTINKHLLTQTIAFYDFFQW